MAKSIGKYRNRIVLKGMRFTGNTGVFDFEREKPQPFVVDLVLCFRQLKAGRTDCLSDTVDYGAVFVSVREIVEGKRFQLIEALAETISTEILNRYPPVDAVEVSVHKPEAPVEGTFEYMGVRFFRERIVKKRGK